MRYRILRFPVLALLLLNGFLFGSATLVEAQQGSLNARLNGDYIVTLNRLCAVDPSGFGADLSLVSGSGAPALFSFQGTMTYNGDGTGSFSGREQINRLGATGIGGFPVNAISVNCTAVTYTVSADGSFTQQMNTCTGTQLNGNATLVGQTITQTGIVLRGQIGTRRRTLIFTDTGVNVETVDRTVATPNILRRICSRSGTAVRQ